MGGGGERGSVSVHNFFVASFHCFEPCPCFASCNCCHDLFIVRSAQTCSPFTGFTQLAHRSRCSRSTLTTFCFCAHVSCSRQCCCRTEAETGFAPISAHFFAVSTFLILRSPSWTRPCIQKYRVSMCFVRCLAPNRSVKEFAVELSLCISIFIGTPRSWCVDLWESNLTSFHHCVNSASPTLNAVKL